MSISKAATKTIPQLIGEKLYLRPLTLEDILKSHHWYLQSDPQTFTDCPKPIHTASEAAEAPSQQRFAIVRVKDEQMVGHIGYRNLNPLNHSAELFVLIDPEERKKGIGREAVRLLSRYLFRFRDLNKLYLSAAEFNTAAIKLAEALHFHRDAELRHHLFYDGEYHDQYLYSLLRFEFNG